jgi:protein disulfide-isomerase
MARLGGAVVVVMVLATVCVAEEDVVVKKEAEREPPPGKARIHSASLPIALDGYCAVTLLESHEWVNGDVRYGVIYRDRLYLFADERRQETFLDHPARYAAVNQGNDLVEQVDHGRIVKGKRDYGVYCDGKIFLFASETSRDKFERTPKRYLRVAKRQEPAPWRPPREYREANEKEKHPANDAGNVGERIARRALRQRLQHRRLH